MQNASDLSFQNYRNFLKVDLDAILHNGMVAKKTFTNKKIMCVLKADAYGHGIEGVLSAYEQFADGYAVATVEEALKIRNKSQKPVLLLGPVPVGQMPAAIKSRLTFTVGSVEYARQLAEQLERMDTVCDCHLKIDTGLNRSGILWQGNADALDSIKELHGYSRLHFTGTYTHFACGEGTQDWEQAFTELQFKRFFDAISAIKACGLPVGVCHCCSTGGALVHPAYQMDMVRLGMLPLGMSYSDESVARLGLKPVAQWVSYIAQIKNVAKGEPVSYGCTFRAPRDTITALVTCGYADGYRRVYSNKASALVGGKRVRVIGRVAMDYLIIDITDIPHAAIGDAVVLLGADGQEIISAQQFSAFGESVSGEVTCAISPRVPRIYSQGKTVLC